MSRYRGKLIVVEGTDGAGKATQCELLRSHFEAQGLRVAVHSFPDYTSSFGKVIAMMLAGEFGAAAELNPYLVAPLYSVDRAAHRDRIALELTQLDIVICDRYVYSNFAYQAGRLSEDRREAFLHWLEELEYGVLGLPKPDGTILLDLAEEASLVARTMRASISMGKRNVDQYEGNSRMQEEARMLYKSLAARFKWLLITQSESGGRRSASEVCGEIARFVEGLSLNRGRDGSQ